MCVRVRVCVCMLQKYVLSAGTAENLYNWKWIESTSSGERTTLQHFVLDVCACVCGCVCVCVSVVFIRLNGVCRCVYICARTCVNRHTCVYMYICMYAYIHVITLKRFSLTHTHTRTHARTHAHTHCNSAVSVAYMSYLLTYNYWTHKV